MLIVCPSCASEYALDEARIGPSGRQVRCARCREAWFVAPPPAAEREIRVEPAPEAAAVPAEPPALSVEARAGRDPVDVPAPPPRGVGRRRSRPRRLTTSPALRRFVAGLGVAALLGGGAGLVVRREAVVRAVPGSARLYERIGLAVNLRGLQFRGVDAEFAPGPGQPTLTVTGEIANVAGRKLPMPPVEIAVRAAPDAPALYTWTTLPDQASLGSGETARFRAKLVEPPAEGRAVTVRFAPDPGRPALAQRAP